MRQRHHGLCDQYGVAPNRLGNLDAQTQPPHPRCEVAEQHLVVKELMWSGTLRGSQVSSLSQMTLGKTLWKWSMSITESSRIARAPRRKARVALSGGWVPNYTEIPELFTRA